MQGTCLEQSCVFTHEGRQYEVGGGGFIGINRQDGKHYGIGYAYPKEKQIGNWHGSIKVPAHYGREYRGNMGDSRQTIYFRYQGISYYGIWYKENSDVIRFREIKG